MYDATLAGLKKWMAHSEKWVAEGRTSTNATTELLERMLRNARTVSNKPEDDPEADKDDDLFCMDAMFAQGPTVD
ncbi:hypothetical protein C8R46DRAFT_1223783 [Mycena filopes]|nr:hypothetical protein C8R46DRAFT_1223783 [Mycena filopes]